MESSSAGSRRLKVTRLFDAAAPTGMYDFDYEQYNDYFGEENYAVPGQVLLKDIFFEPVDLDPLEVTELKEGLCDLVQSLASPIIKNEVAAFSTPRTWCEMDFLPYCEFAVAQMFTVVEGVPRKTVQAIESSVNNSLEVMLQTSTDIASKVTVVPAPTFPGVPYTDSAVYPMPRVSITSLITFEGINLEFLHSAPGLPHDEHSLCKLAAEGAATAFTAAGLFQPWIDIMESKDDLGCWEMISSYTDNSVTVEVSLEAPFVLDFASQYRIACNAVEAVKASLDSGISAHSLFGSWGTDVEVDVGMEMWNLNSDVTPGCSLRDIPTDVLDYADAMSPYHTFGDYSLDYMSPSSTSGDYAYDYYAFPAAAPGDYTWDYSSSPASAPGWYDYSGQGCTSFLKEMHTALASSPTSVYLNASPSSFLLQTMQHEDGSSGSRGENSNSYTPSTSGVGDSSQSVGSNGSVKSGGSTGSGGSPDTIDTAGNMDIADPTVSGNASGSADPAGYGGSAGAEGTVGYDGTEALYGSYGK